MLSPSRRAVRTPRWWRACSRQQATVDLPAPLRPVNQITQLCWHKRRSFLARETAPSCQVMFVACRVYLFNALPCSSRGWRVNQVSWACLAAVVCLLLLCNCWKLVVPECRLEPCQGLARHRTAASPARGFQVAPIGCSGPANEVTDGRVLHMALRPAALSNSLSRPVPRVQGSHICGCKSNR